MPINGYFSWIFDQFFTFFIDCGHIHVPKGTWCWVFFYFGVHCSWLGMAQKRFILDQNWPNMAGLSTFQSGPKGTKIVNPSVFDHFLPFWALLDSFRLFQTKIAFLLLSTSAKPEINIKNLLYPFGAKKSFLSCHVLSWSQIRWFTHIVLGWPGAFGTFLKIFVFTQYAQTGCCQQFTRSYQVF